MSREAFVGKRIAIFGLGRSGLSVAKASLQIGANPTVYDETERDRLAKPELADDLAAMGVPGQYGWDRRWHPSPDFVVTNPAVSREHPVLESAVRSGITVLSEVEFAYRISRAPIVAITGTNGKSTTTVMTMLALRGIGEDAVLCGNIYGSGYDERPLTDAALEAAAEQVLVAEISSFQLEWVSEFRPVAAAITTITPDHLNRYGGSLNEYAKTKMRIWSAQGAKEFAVYPTKDPLVIPPTGPTLLGFEPVDPGASAIQVLGVERSRSDFAFVEPHNFSNAVTAVLLAYGLASWKSGRERGDLVPAILEGLTLFKGIAHRMEAVGERDGVLVINNSMCTNPDAVIKSAIAVNRPTHLLVGGTNKDLDFFPLKLFLEHSEHRAYLFGSDAQDLSAMLGGKHPAFGTLDQAFEAAAKSARAGEAIMLAPGCASTDQFRDFADRGNVFTKIAKEWLADDSVVTPS